MGKGKEGKGKGDKGGDKGKGKGKWGPPAPEGPPDQIEEVGEVSHECEDEIIVKCTNAKVPHFNARMFLENKEEIGKVDEIFGPINAFYFSVKPSEGMKASSFKKGKKLYIDTWKLLPLARFLPEPPISKKGGGKGKGKDGGKGKGKGKGDKGKGKGKADRNDDLTVFLRGLSFDLDEATLRKDFGECGELDRVTLPMNEEGRPKGIAFLQFKTEEGVKKALEFDQTEYSGRTIGVAKAGEGKGEKGKGKDDKGKGKGKDGKGKKGKGKGKTSEVEFAGKKQTFGESDDDEDEPKAKKAKKAAPVDDDDDDDDE